MCEFCMFSFPPYIYSIAGWAYSHQFCCFSLGGTTRSRDTDTPDESGVGESIISNDSPADSGGGVIGAVPLNTTSTDHMSFLPTCKTMDTSSVSFFF